MRWPWCFRAKPDRSVVGPGSQAALAELGVRVVPAEDLYLAADDVGDHAFGLVDPAQRVEDEGQLVLGHQRVGVVRAEPAEPAGEDAAVLALGLAEVALVVQGAGEALAG